MSAAVAVTRVGCRQFMASPPSPLPNLIIISGKEHLLADDVLKQIVASTLPDESLRPLNLDTLDAPTTDDFSVLAEKLQALPFLADRRIVTVRAAVELRNDDRIKLRAAITQLHQQSMLVIDDSGEPKPQRGRAPKDKVESDDFAADHEGSLLVNTTLEEAERE